MKKKNDEEGEGEEEELVQTVQTVQTLQTLQTFPIEGCFLSLTHIFYVQTIQTFAIEVEGGSERSNFSY